MIFLKLLLSLLFHPEKILNFSNNQNLSKPKEKVNFYLDEIDILIAEKEESKSTNYLRR